MLRAQLRRTSPGFTARVDNPWFPLKPGTTLVYRGVKDGKPARDVVTVTHRTKMIDGAPCVVVKDRLYLDGRLAERTTDWYTQDAQGQRLVLRREDCRARQARPRHEHRRNAGRPVSTAPSPGSSCPRTRASARRFRQEYYKGHAEDHFKVVGLHATVTSPYRSSDNALLTKEWTPLEPGVIDHKCYVRGIGTVLEQTVKGGNERHELVSLRRGA